MLLMQFLARFLLKSHPRQPVQYKIRERKHIQTFKSDLRTQGNLHLHRQLRSILESEHEKNILKTGTESDLNIFAEESDGNV